MISISFQENCIFECKLEAVAKDCRCLPWFLNMTNLVPICNLFGNKCYEQKMLQINEGLDFESEHPDCDCYPPCQYSSILNPVENKVFKFLKLYWRNHLLELLLHQFISQI